MTAKTLPEFAIEHWRDRTLYAERELLACREAYVQLIKCYEAKDKAMGVLFKRLADNHIDVSDLIS